jgi:3-hydroxybutyryl-CoA dehydrogenase
MNVLVIGDEGGVNECRQKFGAGHNYIREGTSMAGRIAGDKIDVIIDFLPDPKSYPLELYRGLHCPLFVNTSKISLRQLNSILPEPPGVCQFGFAGLPTFLNREIMEVSLHRIADKEKLNAVCNELNTSFQIVEDRVGLVTPRVIGMIINEAYFTVEAGTASRDDIDLAMKLGTHYPFGPFEWCRKIGIRHVYELLQAVYEDSRDERYKVCPLLKEECFVL